MGHRAVQYILSISGVLALLWFAIYLVLMFDSGHDLLTTVIILGIYGAGPFLVWLVAYFGYKNIFLSSPK